MNARAWGIAPLMTLTLLVLAGCGADPLASQYREGSEKNYIAGDGSITEIAAEQRGPAPRYSAPTDDGASITSESVKDHVVVVNFWYASCPPCRAEATDLEAVYKEFAKDAVTFFGVNVRDQPETAKAFAAEFGVSYPSVIDANDGAAQLAFSGAIAPNAVPTTLVLDKQGRVAARILGRIASPSILETLIRDALTETD